MKRPLLRYHGGKFRISSWYSQMMPDHKIYMEPFCGAASVLFGKDPSNFEKINDLDSEIVNVLRVVRDPEQSKTLARLIELTPWARDEFELAYESASDPVERARRTLVRSWQGFGSAAATKGQTGWRTGYCVGSKSHATAKWAEFPDLIDGFQKRLKGVSIDNRPALEFIERADSDDTLMFVDPPYLPSTRVLDCNKYYSHEMNEPEHENLLRALLGMNKSMVMICGYDSEMYMDMLEGWTCLRKSVAASARAGSATRTECVWLNPALTSKQVQIDIFGTQRGQ